MDYTQKLRIKTAMIIYELEVSLGNYVIDNSIVENIPDSHTNIIIQREKLRGTEIGKEDLNLIIEASYLDEIFNFAIVVTDGSSLNQHVRNLKELCSFLGIFNIRNAVSHPNRPFPDSYWFRAATIASDPVIEKLKLTSVRNALNSAIEESLNAPPDEWLYNVIWAIPNSLPSTFDHEITGLLGRDKEFKDLEHVLSKERNNLIAIVAPGGIGKTALVLQYLKDLSLSPQWSSKFSSIVFCSLKNERLTADGIEMIEAINGINQIKDTILHDLKSIYNKPDILDFEEATNLFENEKILICIDNLETILIDSQKEFIDFNQSLPLKWRVLVTSRISLDSATTVPLEPLIRRHSVNLSRNYLRKRGIIDFQQSDLEKIVDAANNNPLAIRLTIDLYIKGGDIHSSISKSQKDIASFSYKNLIESLKTTSITLLEAIYAIGAPTKSDFSDFLDFTSDEITESLNELSKTSLIIRRSDEFGNDTYLLSDSIRDLLLTNPKNIEIRNKILENVKKRKSKILEQSARIKQLGLTEFDDDFIPDDIDSSAFSLITDLNRSLIRQNNSINHSALTNLKEKFNDLIRIRNNDSLLLYHYSRIFRELRDAPNELNFLLKAEKNNADSPRIKLAIALRFFYNNDYEDALQYFESLIVQGYNSHVISNKKFSFTVTKLYYLSLLFLGDFEKIIEKTASWKTEENWRGLLGVYRATALKRRLEYKYTAVNDNEKIVQEILETFNIIFASEGYFDASCVESHKIIKDLTFIISPTLKYSDRIKELYVSFIAIHFFNIVSKLRNENINSVENKDFLQKIYLVQIQHNALHDVTWYKVEKNDNVYDKEHIKELIEDNYEIVTVYHIPEDKGYGISSFMFAENSENSQFYLSVANFEEGWNRWGFIKEGSKLAIKTTSIKQEGKPTPATEIVEIDQY